MPDPAEPFVDAVSLRVHAGGRSWPFDIDLVTGELVVDLDGAQWTLPPLRWREKLTLARYAASASALLDAALVAHRLSGARPTGPGPAAAAEWSVLVALARWLNGFAGPVDLDPVEFARVAAVVCRRTGLSPADLDDRLAAEVELLAGDPADSAGQDAITGTAGSAAGAPDDGVTRIVVVPDPPDGDAQPEAAGAAVRPAPGDEPTPMPAGPPATAAPPTSPSRPSRHRPPAQSGRRPLGIVGMRASGTSDLPFLAVGQAAHETAAAGAATDAPATGASDSTTAPRSTAPEPAAPEPAAPEPTAPEPAALEPTAPGASAPPPPPGAGPATVERWPPAGPVPSSQPVPPLLEPPVPVTRATGRPLRTRPDSTPPLAAAVPPHRPYASPSGTSWPAATAPAVAGERTLTEADLDAVVAALTERLDRAVAELGLDPAD